MRVAHIVVKLQKTYEHIKRFNNPALYDLYFTELEEIIRNAIFDEVGPGNHKQIICNKPSDNGRDLYMENLVCFIRENRNTEASNRKQLLEDLETYVTKFWIAFYYIDFLRYIHVS